MTVSGNSNSLNNRSIIEAGIDSVDVANLQASAYSKKSGIITIDLSHYVGAIQVIPSPGEQWRVQMVRGAYYLHSRLPFNDANQVSITPTMGQHVIGSGEGPVELSGTQVNIDAPAMRLGNTLYRDHEGQLQYSTDDGSSWLAVSSGGGGGDGTGVFGEIPAGSIDGSNTTFTTSQNFQSNTTAVYVNGLREIRTLHYTESAPVTIDLDDAPMVGDEVTVDYIVAS